MPVAFDRNGEVAHHDHSDIHHLEFKMPVLLPDWNRLIFSAAMLIGCVPIPEYAIAEILPTRGTFEGVYHRDRAGVGHFLFFIVSPDLHQTLAKHDGQLIRLEVTKGTQPINPGPAIIQAVGKIKRLPQPPVGIQVRTQPQPVIAGQPFQLIVELTNNSKDRSLLKPIHVMSTIRQPVTYSGLRPDSPSLFVKGYTNGQLAMGERHTQMGGWKSVFNSSNLTTHSRGRLLLPPRASYVWVATYPEGIPAADSELKIDIVYALVDPETAHANRKSQRKFETWQTFPVQKAGAKHQTERGTVKRLKVSDIVLTPEADTWTNFRVTLQPRQGTTVLVPGTVDHATGAPDPEKYAHLAVIEGQTENGTRIDLEAARLPVRGTRHGHVQLLKLPQAGVTIAGRFRKRSRFAPRMTGLSLRVLTGGGIETVTLSDKVQDRDLRNTMAFGATVGGVKLRVKPAKKVFPSNEPMKFHLQAVNTIGKPVCWWRPSAGLGEKVVIEVDGKPVKQPAGNSEYIGGWAADWTCKNPEEWTIVLPESNRLAVGNHVFRYIIISDGGTYKNANNRLIPIVRGTIVSNKATFSVK